MNRKRFKDYRRRLSHKIEQRKEFSIEKFMAYLSDLVEEKVLVFPDDDFSVSIRNRKLTLNNTKTIEIAASRFRRESRKILRQLENSDQRFLITNKGKREFVCISINEYESLLATKNSIENHVDNEFSSGLSNAKHE
jgi:PHD/YefM family antitoxin component YafN of YafNO toxin-antitoxin module